jgi:AcrR family transcriptional regulator
MVVDDKTGTRSKTPTELSPRATQILEATEALLAERGPDGVSMRDIAQRAGVNKALIFYYFGSRSELFDKVLDRYRTGVEAVTAAASKGASARDKILSVVDALMDTVDSRGGLYARLMSHELARKEAGLQGLRDDAKTVLAAVQTAAGKQLGSKGEHSAAHFTASLLSLIAGSYAFPGVIAGEPLSDDGRRERRGHVRWAVGALFDASAK